MGHHQRVLQEWIEALSVTWCMGKLSKGIFNDHKHSEKQEGCRHKRRDDIWHKLSITLTILPHNEGAIHGQEPEPEQHRPLLPPPQCRHHIKRWHGSTGDTRHILQPKIVR